MGCQRCRGIRDVLRADRDSRYSGAKRDIWGIRDLGAPRGVVGCYWGIRGCRGCHRCLVG